MPLCCIIDRKEPENKIEYNGIYYQINGHVTYMIGDKYMYMYDVQ